MKTLIKNGIVVSGTEQRQADILIEDEKIKKVDSKLTETADQIFDASGKYVFPGFIDAHTHFDLDAGEFRTADDFYSGTKAAVRGGTTTIIDFATQEHGQSLMETVAVWNHMSQGKCSCDYGYHMSITDWNPSVREEIREMTRQGISSYKLYMAYKNLKVDDGQIYEILKAVKEENGIIGVHCENGSLVDARIQEYIREDAANISFHPKSRPADLEAEAIHRLLVIAKLADVPVNIVHLSTQAGMEEVRKARKEGQRVYVETCPQYLLLTDECYDQKGFEGSVYVCSPPLRSKWDQQNLWEALAADEIQTISTDHCSFTLEQKKRGLHDFSRIPNGLPGVEHRPVLCYTYGVETKKISIIQMCRVLAENPAKLFGMYPQKGAILPGSDADLVIWDPSEEWIIQSDTQMQNTDNTPYENFAVRGMAEYVFLRGKLVVKKGNILAECQGKYIYRKGRKEV